MEYNLLKCGEIIYVNNELKFVCCLCDNNEYLAHKFEEHIYAVHLSYKKIEELNLLQSPNNETSKNQSLMDCDPIKNKNVMKQEEMIFDDDLATITQVENVLPSLTLPVSSSAPTTPSLSSPQPTELLKKPVTSSQTNCTHCKKDFFDNKILKNHNRNKQLSCPICKKNMCGIRMLNEHMIAAHLESIPTRIKPKRKAKISYHYCDICNGTFKSYQNLKRHMIIHTGEKPFGCDECDKRFTNRAGLICHVRNHHQEERPFLCNECGKSFKMLMALNLRIRTNHRPRQPQPCPLCPKVLSKRKSLLAHIRRHTANTSCKCNECGKILKSSQCLRQHEKIHLEIKLYQCPFCDMRFAQSAGRRGHIRNMHELI